MKPFIKAILAFLFAVLWFMVICLGITVLAIPQLTVNAYGKSMDLVGRWVDFMEDVFDSFKEW